jgi:hypothetical protein
MGRYAMVLCSIWEDDDFRALSEGAQRCYLLLVSQRRRSMVGVLPYTPRSWARGCENTDIDDIEREIAELECANFVRVDLDTDELLVRTVLKHDPARGPKSIVAMWRSIDAIESRHLRSVVMQYVPEDAWLSTAVPDWAKAQRNGASTGASRPEKPLDTLPPSTDLLPPTSVIPEATADDGSEDAPTDEATDDDERVMKIAELLVRERMKGKTLSNPDRYASKTLTSVITECTARIIELLDQFPDAPDTLIAAAVHTGETRTLAAYALSNVVELPVAPPPDWVRNRTKPGAVS